MQSGLELDMIFRKPRQSLGRSEIGYQILGQV